MLTSERSGGSQLTSFFCLWVGVWGGPAPTSDFSGDSGLRSGAWALHEKVTRAWGLQMTGPEAHSLCVFFFSCGLDPCMDFSGGSEFMCFFRRPRPHE